MEGTKTIELRRNRAGCEVGTEVVIYASFPAKRVVGKCVISCVFNGTPEGLWPQVRGGCGCTREEYDHYFAGASAAYGLVLGEVTPLAPTPLPFRGPQSYRYLFADEAEQLQVLKAAGLVVK